MPLQKPLATRPFIKQHLIPTQSYTALVKHKLATSISHDRDLEDDALMLLLQISMSDSSTSSPLTVTGSRYLGTLLHTLFEKEPFSQAQMPLQQFKESSLIHRRFYQHAQKHFSNAWIEKHIHTLKEMIWHTLNKPILDNYTLPLHQIPDQQQQHELEFLLYLHQDITFTLNDHSFYLKTGYLKGIIDLLFEHNGKLYIVDWKSSYLGDHLENYQNQSLSQAMQTSLYTLQYHLYLLGLMQFIKSRESNFSYDRIGGVYYLFVRGTPFPTPQSGVYFVPTSAAFLQDLYEQFAPALRHE